MDFRRLLLGARPSWQPKHALVVMPLTLMAIIAMVDILSPPDVRLASFLVAAPAVTVAFAGPRMVGFVGILAVSVQTVLLFMRTSPWDVNRAAQLMTLVLISAFITFLAYLRELHEKRITQLQSVAEAAQEVLMRPLPRRVGPLTVASVYLAAEAEAQIGGDLYAAARTTEGSRFIIGDVRGKGLQAIGDAGLVLGAFRAAAHRQDDLPVLVAYLEGAVSSDLDKPGAGSKEQEDPGEAFVTALVLDIPDTDSTVRLINCGHPAPLLLRGSQVTPLEVSRPAPPLGLTEFLDSGFETRCFPFEVGDVLLLCTDGVLEARDGSGAFYPLSERVASWPDRSPDTLLQHLRHDLLRHVRGNLADDAAMVAIERLPVSRPTRQCGPR